MPKFSAQFIKEHSCLDLTDLKDEDTCPISFTPIKELIADGSAVMFMTSEAGKEGCPAKYRIYDKSCLEEWLRTDNPHLAKPIKDPATRCEIILDHRDFHQKLVSFEQELSRREQALSERAPFTRYAGVFTALPLAVLRIGVFLSEIFTSKHGKVESFLSQYTVPITQDVISEISLMTERLVPVVEPARPFSDGIAVPSTDASVVEQEAEEVNNLIQETRL